MGTPYFPMAKSGFSIGVLVCELNICIPCPSARNRQKEEELLMKIRKTRQEKRSNYSYPIDMHKMLDGMKNYLELKLNLYKERILIFFLRGLMLLKLMIYLKRT